MRAWSKNGLDRLDVLVSRHVAVDGVPGAAWLVARDGEVHVGTAGTVDGSEPVRRDSIFRIASMTKPVTAEAVLVVAGEGRPRLHWPPHPGGPPHPDPEGTGDLRGPGD